MAYKGQTAGEYASEAQRAALQEHLVRLCLYLKVLPKNVIGHREVPGMFTILGKGSVKYKKTCPGMSVDLNLVREETTLRLQRRLGSEGLYHGRIDGDFGKKSRAALAKFDVLKHCRRK
jgi:hypothetical protein